MKILMVSSFLPYPLHSGGHVRLYNLIKELSQKNEITLVCEKRSHQSAADVEEVEKICKKIITVDRKKQWSFDNLLRSISSKNSFLTTGHTHKEMHGKINEELAAGNFDLIHVETFYVMQNLPDTSIPIVLVEHNIEYMVYKKFADRAPLFLGSIFNIDIAKIKKEEEKSWLRVDKLVAVSQNDADVMAEKGLSPVIVSNGVDTEKFGFRSRVKTHKSKAVKILFIGDFKWIQNRDAAKFIVDEIWPLIKKRLSIVSGEQGDSRIDSGQARTRLWIVGRKIPDSIKNLSKDSDIIFDEEGSGRPTEDLFQEAEVLLAPIRVGGGTSYKILESMSCGTPVITTELSANAIGAEGDKNIMVGKNAEELAKKTAEILENNKLYDKIAENGRKLIEENYTWKKISKELMNVYRSVIASD